MRKNLKSILGIRSRFTATVEQFGTKSSFKGKPLKTILLIDVYYINNEKVADHLWMTCGKWSKNIKVGDKIAFDARVSEYIKGYKGYRDDVYGKPITKDYRLERPTKVIIL